MKKTFTLGLVMMGFLATNTQAETRNIESQLTETIRLNVTQSQAARICRKRAERLPTIRELAQEAQRLGAAGISEVPREGYYLVRGLDINGKADHFYFSNKGYTRPQGDLGRQWFWSSSVDPVYSDSAYSFAGQDGVIYNIDLFRSYEYNISVRCVR